MKKGDILRSGGVRIFVLIFIIFMLFYVVKIEASSYGTSGTARLNISDDTDSSTKFSLQNFTFYSNYTNTTSSINVTLGNGYCNISFNETGTYGAWQAMRYNSTFQDFTFNRNFTYKGIHSFWVNCTSNYGNISLEDNFTITNSIPVISQFNGFIDIDGVNNGTEDSVVCVEDTLCSYNFSRNVTDIDANDILLYGYNSIGTTLTNFTINSSTGMLNINVTSNAYTGSKQVELTVRDTESPTYGGFLRVGITAVNDAPTFSNLINRSFNMSSLFNYNLSIIDEESNLVTFNVTFLSCNIATWSTRGSNCTLFGTANYNTNGTVMNISFTPSKNDVGDYIINFSMNDSGSPSKITSQIVNFTVLDVNSAPVFSYVCDNQRSATESIPFFCQINITDYGESQSVTLDSYYGNTTWFLDDSNIALNITTGYNSTKNISFTPTDANVGNWSITISAVDNGNPQKINLTTFQFFVQNENDSVLLGTIPNITAYTTQNSTLYVNASDNDLLIPDKSLYNETIRFISNVSWVNVTSLGQNANTNNNTLKIEIYTNSSLVGIHSVNITAYDSNNFSFSSKIFNVTITDNNAPSWNSPLGTNFSLVEGNTLSLNISQNVTDLQNQALNFTYSNVTPFSSFSLNASTGIINFVAVDADIGEHILMINVSDGVSAPVTQRFNITINNTNDIPYSTFFSVVNASKNGNQVNASEDNVTVIYLYAEDGDFDIPSVQKGFYNESFNVSTSVVGNNTNLLSFIWNSSYINISRTNQTQLYAQFTPNHSSLGLHIVNVSFVDNSGVYSSLVINVSVDAVNHAPVLINANNLAYSILENISYDFSATDIEDAEGNLTFSLTNLTTGGNFTIINSTTGAINFTLNSTYTGIWRYNLSVNDTSGLRDSELINITVYDYPKIGYPDSNQNFSLVENQTYTFTFNANHTVGNNLNYTLYINNIFKNNTLDAGNGTNFTISYTTNFTEETTCSGDINMTLVASNGELSNSTNYSVQINHTNYPLTKIADIGGAEKIVTGAASVSLSLSSYFQDYDASDVCVNQTIRFTSTNIAGSLTGGAIGIALADWVNTSNPSVTFSASSTGTGRYYIVATEYNSSNSAQEISNVASNNFTTTLTVTTTTETVTTPTTGGSTGGGGGGTGKTISMKLVLPGPLSSARRDKIILPITVSNTGQTDMTGIILRGTIAKNGVIRKDLIASFDRSTISSLKAGAKENVTFIVDVNTEDDGLYEISINATVTTPVFSDYGKIYLTVDEGKKIEDRIFFVEQYINDNPKCLELKELLDDAQKSFDSKNYTGAREKLDGAFESCKKIIADEIPMRSERARETIKVISLWTIFALSALALIIGLLLYYYKRFRLRRALHKGLPFY